MTMKTIENIYNGLIHSAGFKLGLIVLLSVILLIPASMIRELIKEREQRQNEIIEEITHTWGESQTLCGPVLTIPVRSPEKNNGMEAGDIAANVHILPEILQIEGTIKPEVRYRGIYKVITYRAILHISGNFNPAEINIPGLQIKNIDIESARFELGIPDMRGINENITINWNDNLIPVQSGIPDGSISNSGVYCEVPITKQTPSNFTFDLDLNGSSSLNFIPAGAKTQIRISSTWKNPSFEGAFLPDERMINEKGFTAKWNVLQLNRNYPQQWINDQYSVSESSFGVELLTPVEIYQKSERSVKYAILFIGLTFLLYFFFESYHQVRIHPVQYLLLGSALCLFYSLLTALAEYLSFAPAYIISSLIIISMITVFTRSVYKKRQITVTMALSLIALYVFLFIALELNEYSLLLGNIGLVIILGLVMYFSRRINWYDTIKNNEAKG
jgi:inner membrane protein